MNRLRISIDGSSKDHTITLPHNWELPWLEDVILRALSTYYQTVGCRLDYLGNYTWDILLEDRKIGRVKAWEEPKPKDEQAGKQLWSFLLLCAFTYLALC